MIGDLHTAALISQAEASTGCACRDSTRPRSPPSSAVRTPGGGRSRPTARSSTFDGRTCRGLSSCRRTGRPTTVKRRSGISCRPGTCGRISYGGSAASAGGSSFASSSPSGSTMGPPSRGCVRSPTATNLRFSRRRDRMPSSGGARRWHRRAFTMSRSSPSGKARWWTRSSPGIRRTVHPSPPLNVHRALDETIGWWWTGRGAASPEPVRRHGVAVTARAPRPHRRGHRRHLSGGDHELARDRGGIRNWDYRYVGFADAALTISVLLTHGYHDEAEEARLAVARDRRRPPGRPDCVRHRRRTQAARVRDPRAPRLRRCEAGSRRQRRVQPATVGHLRRGHGRAPTAPDRRLRRDGGILASSARF